MQYERFEGSWFLKSNWHLVKTGQSDQSKGVPVPPQEEPPAPEDCVIDLPPPDSILKAFGETQEQKNEASSGRDMKSREKVIPDVSKRAAVLYHLLNNRKSRRKYTEESLTIEQLSYLLWAIEGVKENRGKFSFRTTPSGGARHPLDIYVFAHKVEGLNVGLYRYLPVEHELVLERQGDDSVALDEALNGQFWNAACVVIWAAVPYRSEWRYGKAAYKLVALDTGHSCQNLYLACESLGLGTCAIGAYDQEKLDAYLGLDGEEMFAIYAAPIGHFA